MSGNKKDRTDISVPDAYLPALRDALVIARNTHMMCGEDAGQEMAMELLETIEAKMPEAMRCFDGGHWARIAQLCAGEAIHGGIHSRWSTGAGRDDFYVILISDSGIAIMSRDFYPKEKALRIAREAIEILDGGTDRLSSRNFTAEEANACREYFLWHSRARPEDLRFTQFSAPGGENHLVHRFGHTGTSDGEFGCARVHKHHI